MLFKGPNSLSEKINDLNLSNFDRLFLNTSRIKGKINLSLDISEPVNLKNIKNKTLIIWGDKDKSYNLKQVKTLEKNISNSSLVIFKGCAHNVHLEKIEEFNVIKNLISKFDNIIIVGGMANNFIEYFGNNVGKSIKENNCNKIVEEIISLSKKEKCKIIYPEDVIVSKDLNGSPQKKELSEILSDEMILDIGPKTLDIIKKIIDSSKTILWNGPAGYFENPNFAYGSIQIAKKIIENNKANKIFSVAGGGDTVSLLNNLKAVNEFNFVSTAGGAFLEYLEGKNLPGITALN